MEESSALSAGGADSRARIAIRGMRKDAGRLVQRLRAKWYRAASQGVSSLSSGDYRDDPRPNTNVAQTGAGKRYSDLRYDYPKMAVLFSSRFAATVRSAAPLPYDRARVRA